MAAAGLRKSQSSWMSSLNDEGADAYLLCEAGELVLTHVTELVDELTQCTAAHEDDRGAQENHAGPGDWQRQGATRYKLHERTGEGQRSTHQHRQRQHAEPQHGPRREG